MNDHYVAGFYGKIELREKILNPALENFENFLNSRNSILREFESQPKVIKIKELKSFLNLDVDWMEIINRQLFKKYWITENDEIQVKNLEMMVKLARNLKEFDKG